MASETEFKLRQALSELLDLVEFAEMSSRDMPAHEFEAIRDGAERQARAALARPAPTLLTRTERFCGAFADAWVA